MPSRLVLSAAPSLPSPAPSATPPPLAGREGWGKGRVGRGIAQDDDCAGAGSAPARLRK